MVHVYESMWRMFATAAVLAILALTVTASPSAAATPTLTPILTAGPLFCEPFDNNPRECDSGLCLSTCHLSDGARQKSNGDWECCY